MISPFYTVTALDICPGMHGSTAALALETQLNQLTKGGACRLVAVLPDPVLTDGVLVVTEPQVEFDAP